MKLLYEDFFDDNSLDIDNELDTEDIDDIGTVKNPEEIKRAAEFVMSAKISNCKDAKVTIQNHFDSLFKYYNDLFSDFYNDTDESLNNKIIINTYYTLNDNLNVNRFYSFSRVLVTMFNEVWKTGTHDFNLIIRKNTDSDYRDYLFYLFNVSTYSIYDISQYLISMIFFANDIFDKYDKRFSLQKVIDSVFNYKTFDYIATCPYKYLNTNKLYYFFPLTTTTVFFSQNYINPMISSVTSHPILVYELLNKQQINIIPVHFFMNHKKSGTIEYNIDEYKDCLKSKYLSYDIIKKSNNASYRTYWHLKPFYFKQKFGTQQIRIPAVAVEVSLNK